MTIDRAIKQIRFWLYLGNGRKRSAYAKRIDIFAEIGNNVNLPATLPLYPKLIKIHNNVIMHHSVKFVTHDRLNAFLSKIPEAYSYKHLECLNPIEIMDNVYIGMNCIILGNVRIGPNVVINSGSIVTHDIPPNSIVAGAPAKVIGQLDLFAKTRLLMDKSIPYEFKRSGKEKISDEVVKLAWEQFDKKKYRKTM